MAAGTVLAILQIISAYTVAPVGRQFGYLFYYNRNIRKLSSGVKKLEVKRDGVIIQVDEAKNNCHVIESEVENWLNLVAQKMEEASLVLIDKEKIRKGCFNEWCLNLKSCHSLSRRARKTTQYLIVLLGEANFQRVSHPPPPPAKVLEPISDNMTIASTSTSKSEGFQSRLSILEGVMKAVRDDDIHVVGICGMGGVGKTTMVEDVEKRAREELLFEEILMVVVGQDQDERRIQSTIAENMRMELGADDLLVRAKALRQRLSIKGPDGKSRKILIILDDLWRKLDLKKVGIPSKDEHASCKIILTTRSRDVCSHMEAQPFDVPVMNFDEACDLFKSSIQTTTMHPNWKDIVKECGGLPIAITIIAMMLRDKEEYTWNHVLGQLQKSSLKGEHVNVYDVFRVSYDYIKDEEIKDIFLLCCLYPEDAYIRIEDLVRNGWGLRVFKDVDKLHEARAAAHAHVEALKNLNLLLHSKFEDCIKMHDLIRDFGISIGKAVVRFDQGLKEWPTLTTAACEQYTSISMQCDEIDELGDGLKYPKLKILHLRRSWSGWGIRPFQFPERLDEILPELQVLSLERMLVPTLFEQVQRLTNLRTLSLCNCKVNDDNLSMIAELKQLEVLTIDYDYSIFGLPTKFCNLSRLRLLDLRGCYNLVYPAVLYLVRLEELYLHLKKPIRCVEEHRLTNHDNIDMKHLENLFSIHINIPYKFLSPDLNLQNLKSFNIIISDEGRVWRDRFINNNLFSNILHLEGNSIVPLRRLLKALQKNTDELRVKVNDIVKLEEEFTNLKILTFESCNELLSAVIHPFANLRHLKLLKCPKLKGAFSLSIVKGLSNLEMLKISDCAQMEEIVFRDDHLGNDEESVVFHSLKTLSLDNLPNQMAFCNAMDREIRFPKLEKMKIKSLPKVTSLYSEICDTTSIRRPFFHQKLDSLDSLQVEDCRSLEIVYDYKDQEGDVTLSTQLTKLCLGNLPELTHVLRTSPHIKICRGFQNLRELQVHRCHKLKCLFPLSIAKCMVMLETLVVSSCDVMEAIFEDGEGEDHNSVVLSAIEFPKLKKLDICNMQSLVGLCRSFDNVLSVMFPQLRRLNLHTFRALHGGIKPNSISEQLHTDGEDELATFFPANMLKQLPNQLESIIIDKNDIVEVIFDLKVFNIDDSQLLPQLQTIIIRGLPKLAHVWRNVPRQVQVFNNLKSIAIRECSSLKYLFTTMLAKVLVSLEKLEVEKCMNMESIVANEEDDDEESQFQNQVLLPQLTDFELYGLPRLSSIFPTTYALNSLKSLSIEDCSVLLDLDYFVAKFSLPELVNLEVRKMENMTTVFPDNLGRQLQSLETIYIVNCNKVEVVFDLEHSNFDESDRHHLKPFSHLHRIELRGLPKLTTVWKNAPTQGFENVRTLYIFDCDSLKQLFTPSTAKALNNLRELIVIGCSVLEEIVADEDELTTEEAIMLFPHLEIVMLRNLPSLSSIVPKPYYVHWSSWVYVDANVRDLMR